MLVENLSTIRKNRLALAFILYNEGKSIAKAIESFHIDGVPIYDYLIVGIDSKTKDDTYEQVSKYCSSFNIIYFDFNNDFSEARNKILDLLEQTDADFILMPDGHEYLMPSSLMALQKYMASLSDKIHLINCMIGMSQGQEKEPDVIFQRAIFFRNKKGIRFTGKVHNYIDVPTKHRVIASDIRFIHSMPKERLKDRRVQREQMNVVELKKNADGGSVRDLFYLGNTYFDLKMYDEAINIYKKCLGLDSDIEIKCQVAIYLASIYLYIKHDYISANYVAHAGLQYKTDRAELYCLSGLSLVLRGYKTDKKMYLVRIHFIKQAQQCFEIAVKLKAPLTQYFIETKYYTWLPWESLMDIYSELRNYDAALNAAKQVLKYKNDTATKENITELEKYVDTNMAVALNEA